jgi:hypothetical protein
LEFARARGIIEVVYVYFKRRNMFSRIREAIRIIAYREPESGPDAVIVERADMPVSNAGRRIAGLLEGIVAIYTIGYIASLIGDKVFNVFPGKHSMSVTVLVGSVAALLTLMVHWVRQDLEEKLRTHFHLRDTLAPYFGKRLDSASRVLRGSVRAS